MVNGCLLRRAWFCRRFSHRLNMENFVRYLCWCFWSLSWLGFNSCDLYLPDSVYLLIYSVDAGDLHSRVHDFNGPNGDLMFLNCIWGIFWSSLGHAMSDATQLGELNLGGIWSLFTHNLFDSCDNVFSIIADTINDLFGEPGLPIEPAPVPGPIIEQGPITPDIEIPDII